MNTPFDKRDLMAALEELEKHLLRSGVTTQSKDGALANFPPLVARREDACQAVVEPQGPSPGGSATEDGDPAKPEILHKLEPVQQAIFSAIEAELKHALRHAARAESSGVATSNAHPNPTDELKSQRQEPKPWFPILSASPMSEPPRDVRSMSWRGSFWSDLPALGGQWLFGTMLPIRPTPRRSTPRLDWPNRRHRARPAPTSLPSRRPCSNSSVGPPPATSGGDAEQPVDASRPQAETPPAIARHGETGLANQAVGAPASPIATQMQAEPVGIAALPEPKKAETASAAPPDAALRPSDVPAQATAAPPLPPRTPAAVPPASTPKTAPPARKAPKPSVAAKLGDQRQPGRIAKPGKATVVESVAKPNSTQPPIPQTEALASKPAAAPESSGAFAYIQRAQEAVGSLPGVVRNWVGMDEGPRP